MTKNKQLKMILAELIKKIELPSYAYEQAKERYESLGKWFDRDGSLVDSNESHIFSQGSFRLGTAIRPLDADEEYDLDLVCKLGKRITKHSHTQERLKMIVGKELEAYRKANGIQDELEEKKRCWRLNYQGNPHFHMDIIPCIPIDENRMMVAKESLRNSVFAEDSKETWEDSVNITDNTTANYRTLDPDWPESNPEGYARWFERRMNLATGFVLVMESAQVEELPTFNKKTTLQQVVQVLKRHRDVWAKNLINSDSKPISIIITTLAARAYNGEKDIAEALVNILDKMGNLVNATFPRVPNPVNLNEDFADRWAADEDQKLQLEKNFFDWLEQAKKDFSAMVESRSTQIVGERIEKSMAVIISQADLATIQDASFDSYKIIPTSPSITKNTSLPLSHVQAPLWPINLMAQVTITATRKERHNWLKFSSGDILPKCCSLFFKADPNVATPYEAFWQVVNTGKEAAQVNELRGEILKASSAGVGGLKKNERTLYTGEHWVECFIVKNGECVAKSGQFFVVIK